MAKITDEQRKQLLKISDLWRCYDQVYSDFAERHGVSTNAMSLIEELIIRQDGVEPAAVADYLGIARQTMTTMLDSLENKGMVARYPHRHDRWRKVVRFTPDGEMVAAELIDKLHEWELQALSTIGAEEQERAYVILRRLAKALKIGLPQPLKNSQRAE